MSNTASSPFARGGRHRAAYRSARTQGRQASRQAHTPPQSGKQAHTSHTRMRRRESHAPKPASSVGDPRVPRCRPDYGATLRLRRTLLTHVVVLVALSAEHLPCRGALLHLRRDMVGFWSISGCFTPLFARSAKRFHVVRQRTG